MATLIGANIPEIPTIDIVGWFSNSWIWVAIVAVIGVILVVSAVLIIFL